MNKENMIWYDRKRLWCGLPWTFTKYGMDEGRLFVETGFLNTREEEVRLYRILNISLNKSLIQRIFGLGTIHIDSTDLDLKCLKITNIKNSDHVKEMLSAKVEEERMRNRVSAREYMHSSDDDPTDLADDNQEYDMSEDEEH